MPDKMSFHAFMAKYAEAAVAARTRNESVAIEVDDIQWLWEQATGRRFHQDFGEFFAQMFAPGGG